MLLKEAKEILKNKGYKIIKEGYWEDAEAAYEVLPNMISDDFIVLPKRVRSSAVIIVDKKTEGKVFAVEYFFGDGETPEEKVEKGYFFPANRGSNKASAYDFQCDVEYGIRDNKNKRRYGELDDAYQDALLASDYPEDFEEWNQKYEKKIQRANDYFERNGTRYE